MYRTTTPSSVFLNDSGPRPLPSYLRQPPPPPPQENVVPCVPDVSLIFGLDGNKGIGSAASLAKLNKKQEDSSNAVSSPSTCLSHPIQQDVMGSLEELLCLVQQQNTKISRIEEQLNTLIKFQSSKQFCENGVQTEVSVPENGWSKPWKPIDPYRDVSPNQSADLSKILQELQLPIGGENTSVYSVHNPAPHVDLLPFLDNNNITLNQTEAEGSPGIGPSVSEFGSSDEEAEVEPTVTYYKNVLGNVNRLLENHATPPRIPKPRVRNGTTQEQLTPNNNLMIQQNVYNSIFIPNGNGNPGIGSEGQERRPDARPRTLLPGQDSKPYDWNSGGTNTTMYGMSSANLSFATRDYLERHGLFNASQSNATFENRVLEPEVRQKQPKFL